MTIGQRIKARRKELGMSQEELASAIGYTSKTTVNKIEKDVNQLRQNKIKDIALALRTTPEYIMGWDEDDSPRPCYYPEEIREIADFFENNPDYRVLFDEIRNVKQEDIEKIASVIKLIR